MSAVLACVGLPCVGAVLGVSGAWAESASEHAAGLNEQGLRLAKEGRLAEAVAAFEAALKQAPEDAGVRRNLGRTSANWGVELLGRGDLLTAEQATRRARDLLPADAVVRLNLAACLDERGYPARAAAEVRKAVELAPDLAAAHDRLGGVLQREGRLEDAAASWQRAAELAPSNKAIAERLVQARASLAAEARLTRQTSAHFEILFDLERDGVLASKVLQAMEEAHGVVGAELQHFGQERLVVVLLPALEFQSLTGSHEWVAGLYDGRIRLPVKDAAQRESDVLARAKHEYVHSVLAPLGKRAPGWLHEGLAQLFEGRSVAQAMRRVASAQPLPFDALSESFAGTRNAERARLKYDTALTFVHWLRDGVRAPAFRRAMAALFDDADLTDAFRAGADAKLPELYERFQASVPR